MTLFRMNSETVTLIIIISLCAIIISTNAVGISCYKCFASHPDYEQSNLLCSQFDASAKFQVYCPKSTFCRKKTIHYKLKTSVITTVIRDCARQTRLVVEYNEIKNAWTNDTEVVRNAYEEDCFAGVERAADVSSELCFCSYHLCNFSPSIRVMNTCHTFLSMAMLLLVKLL